MPTTLTPPPRGASAHRRTAGGDATPTTAGAGTLALASRLRPVVLHLSRHLRREVHALGSSVTAGQVEILTLISGRPGIGVNELAGLVGISAPAMSNAIDKLEAADLALRTRETAGDRRRVGLTVSAEGARVVRAARTSRTAWLAGQLRELTAEQLAALEAAIDPLNAIIRGRVSR